MATMTALATAWQQTTGITNPSNAFTNTSSTTYASLVDGTYTAYYIQGYGFSSIPDGSVINSVTIKVKGQTVGAGTAYVNYYKSATTWIDLHTFVNSEGLVTKNLTPSGVTVQALKDGMVIRFDPDGNTFNVYGTEIIVDYTPPASNSLFFGMNF